MYAFISRPPFVFVITSRPVVLAQMPRHFFPCHPAKRQTARPRSRVRAGVLDRDIVLQSVEVRARESLDEPKLIGVRKTAVGEPEILVEAPGIGHQRVALPFPDRTAV